VRKPPLAVYVLGGLGFQALVYSALPRLFARRDRRLGWRHGEPGLLNRAGLVPVALGAAFLAWAVVGHYRAAPDDAAPTAMPDYLAQGGAYAVSRNPLYVGGMTMWFGWAVFLGSRRAAVAGAALLVGMGAVGVPWEEHLLKAKFGDTYDAYVARVPRWL
jgi:protein-S-isoprenylcysteine O-methyltransferase Ste14